MEMRAGTKTNTKLKKAECLSYLQLDLLLCRISVLILTRIHISNRELPLVWVGSCQY